MRAALAAAALLAPAIAHAGDSTWLLCTGVATVDSHRMYVAASVVEGRKTADTRAVWITLIKGGHEMRGELPDDADGGASGSVALAIVPNDPSIKPSVTFKGTAKLPSDFGALTLTGQLDTNFGEAARPSFVAFSGKLACKTLDDLAIGHGG